MSGMVMSEWNHFVHVESEVDENANYSLSLILPTKEPEEEAFLCLLDLSYIYVAPFLG